MGVSVRMGCNVCTTCWRPFGWRVVGDRPSPLTCSCCERGVVEDLNEGAEPEETPAAAFERAMEAQGLLGPPIKLSAKSAT